MRFKTKKQKLMHHNSLEPECKTERCNLVKLIGYFKRCLFTLYKNYNLTENDLLNDSDYVSLQEKYLETEQKILDTDFFYHTLGEKFSYFPKNLED
jgi:hypothetical protein